MYFALRTANLCQELQAQNYTLSFDVKRIRLLGLGIFTAIYSLWISSTLIVIFGWSEFRRHYCSTILVGQLIGLSNTLYRSILLLYGIDDEGKIKSYFIPSNILFLLCIGSQCFIVMRKIKHNSTVISYSRWHVFMVLLVPYLTMYPIAIFYKYAVVTWFNSMDNNIYRFLLAMSTPALPVVPTALCRHMALWRTSEIIKPERSFALVDFLQGMFITLYRIMQANFGNTGCLWVPLSTFLRLHWHNIPMARVWSKYWKRHIFANAVTVVVLVCYFTEPLLAVFQKRFHDTSIGGNFTIRNCTLPYEGWC